MIKKYIDFVPSIILIFLGIILAISTNSIKIIKGMSYSLGSDFMPKVGSSLLIIIGLAILIQASIKFKSKAVADDEVSLKPVNLPVIYTLISLLAFVGLVEKLGFLITSMLYLMFQIYILTPKGKFSFIKTGVISITTSIIIYFIFVNFFKLILPAGILG
ncbi:tripartite tricarboxylate transporter TctB family protein [Natronincola ferrireducens]|uniref:Tripartite tricarboxylate transporter TctB family protein n=1 Tax=Natronincola ferrireducens TaxID=393762 RepID=A0A1G9GER3_9FIRM|nr:tripartite tricarboxylate transporter TctB family protein [Natronincola ferrireducens]SDK99127.1 Tripartite tricarboxylate transporter TctB family protein [Natronincola ferrireducens]